MNAITRHYFTAAMRDHDRVVRAATRKAATILTGAVVVASAITTAAVLYTVALFSL